VKPPVALPVHAKVEAVNVTPTRAKNNFQLVSGPFGATPIPKTADVDVTLVAGNVSTPGAPAFTGTISRLAKRATNTNIVTSGWEYSFLDMGFRDNCILVIGSPEPRVIGIRLKSQ
jgi:hypothetical protein